MQIQIKAKTNASKNEIIKVKDDFWEVRTTKGPHEGEANKAIVEAVAKELGVAKSRVSIAVGVKSRTKVIVVT